MNQRIVPLALTVLALLPAAAGAQHYAEENGWYFCNWDTDPLPWETYRDTYLGIPPTRDPASSAFDVLFYDHLYRSELSGEGNCYGMAVQSLLMFKNGGHLGFCAPVSQYSGHLTGNCGGTNTGPTDPRLTRVINQMHGHQVNTETLRFFLDRIASGKTRDGNFAYDQVNYYKLRQDPTLVSITESTSPADGGHTMVAYDARFIAGKKRILLYDPNRPWPLFETYYTGEDNLITIESSGAWSFTMRSGTVWSGSATSGGNILISPLSVTAPLGRVPTSLGIDAISAVTTLFIFAGDGELEQLTDAGGRRLYRPGSREIDTDPATGLGTVLPWFPSDQAGDRDRPRLAFSTYYIFGESQGALELDLSHSGDEYGLRMIGPRGSVEISARGGNKKDRLTLADVGRGLPRVVFSGRAPRTYDVLLTHASQPGERVRQFRVQDLALPGGGAVELAVAADGSALAVTAPPEYELTLDLELRRQTRYDAASLEAGELTLAPGETRIVQPDSWIDLPWARLEARRQAVAKVPGEEN